jgi:hypothetical protein
MAPSKTVHEAMIPAAPPSALGEPIPLIINENVSPELAIKLAYDFARSLRATSAPEADFAENVQKLVETPYAGSPLLLYIRAGFKAGYFYETLPWRRQIEAGDYAGKPVRS